MTALYAAVPDKLTDPWQKGGEYRFDRELLSRLIGVQVDSGSAVVSASGGLALAVDVWIASELRRAGLEHDAVWPRMTKPRMLPQSLARATTDFKYSAKAGERAIQRATIDKLVKAAGNSNSNVLGGFFAKEIDVVVAEYDRGLELGVSTKTMTGSFAKNVANRFEEASGDLLNIRRRYPLATFGYAYLVTANVFEELPAWEKIKDMLRKLTSLSTGDESDSYDATCLMIVDWEGGDVTLNEDDVPADLSPDRFFERLLRTLFSRSPVAEHATARDLWASSRPRDSQP